MSAPEVLTHSDLEVAGENGGRISNWPKMKSNADYRHLPHPEYTQPEYTQPEYSYPEAVPAKAGKSGTICGVKSKIFCIALAVAVVMLAIGLGVGIGAGMAIRTSSQSATSSPTATTTVTQTQTVTATSATGSSTSSSSSASNFSPSTLVSAVIPQNGTVALDCPNIDASTIRIPIGATTWRFTVSCGTDTVAANQDILAVIVYSLSACAEACASYNHNYGQSKCVAATFNSNLTASVGPNYGSCWLKNGTTGGIASTRNDYAGLRLQS